LCIKVEYALRMTGRASESAPSAALLHFDRWSNAAMAGQKSPWKPANGGRGRYSARCDLGRGEGSPPGGTGAGSTTATATHSYVKQNGSAAPRRPPVCKRTGTDQRAILIRRTRCRSSPATGCLRLSTDREERTGVRFEEERVYGHSGGEGAAQQTLSPGDRADPGLASVRGLDWLGPNRRREGCIHVHQT